MSAASEALDVLVDQVDLAPYHRGDYTQVSVGTWRHATRKVMVWADAHGLFRTSIIDATTERVLDEKFALNGRRHDELTEMARSAINELSQELDSLGGDDDRCEVAHDEETGQTLGIRCHHHIDGDVLFTREDLALLLAMPKVLRYVPPSADWLLKNEMLDLDGMYVTLNADGRTKVQAWLDALH